MKNTELFKELINNICRQVNIPVTGSILDQVALINTKLKYVPYIEYPVSLSTVDIIATDKDLRHLVLGKKYNQTHWQFPGGFRDPKETSQEAAKREFLEEACLDIDVNRFDYVGDLFVDDRRYKDSPHKITTTIFHVILTGSEIENIAGGDDLEYATIFNIDELIDNKEAVVRDVHHKLFDVFINKVLKIIG